MTWNTFILLSVRSRSNKNDQKLAYSPEKMTNPTPGLSTLLSPVGKEPKINDQDMTFDVFVNAEFFFLSVPAYVELKLHIIPFTGSTCFAVVMTIVALHWTRYSHHFYWWSYKAHTRQLIMWCVFYHDVDEIFWPQPMRSLKLGHVTGQGSMSPTWVGRVSDPGKMAFIKSVKTWIILVLLYIWFHL